MKSIQKTALTCIAVMALWQMGLAAEPVASVVLKRGKVNVIRASEKNPVEARSGTVLYDGDKITTLEAALCGIKFWDDKSLLRIKEKSTCIIEAKKVENKVNKNIIAQVGSFFTRITQPGGTFSVTTPTSVASVKGTEWWTLQMLDGRSLYICLEGLVDLESGAGKFLVKEGQTAIFPGPNQTPEIRITKPEEVPTWDEDIGELRSLEIEFQDPDGKTRKMIIELEDK